MSSIPSSAVPSAKAQRRFLSSSKNFRSRSLCRFSPSVCVVRLAGSDSGTDTSAVSPPFRLIKPSQWKQSSLDSPCGLLLLFVCISISRAHTSRPPGPLCLGLSLCRGSPVLRPLPVRAPLCFLPKLGKAQSDGRTVQ